jgi:hypothetical protein
VNREDFTQRRKEEKNQRREEEAQPFAPCGLLFICAFA